MEYHFKRVNKLLYIIINANMSATQFPNYPACQRHGIILIGINVIIRYMMHYEITFILI